MAFTKIKTKDLARSATLQRSRRRRMGFLSASNNSRFFDERSSRQHRPKKNKRSLSSATAVEAPQSEATTATMAAKSTYISPAVEPQQDKSKTQKSSNKSTPKKKTRPEISLIKKEQEASSETSESSNSSTRPPSIFDRDEVNGKTGPVDTPPSSPASETAPDSETKKKKKKQDPLQQQQQQQQKQQSKTSSPRLDAKRKTKAPVDQVKSDRTKESAKPQIPSSPNHASKPSKPTKIAGQSRPGKKNEMLNSHSQRQQFLDSLDRRWPNPNVGGNGLHNPKNYCYRRSVLQCLLNIPIFVNWLSEHQIDNKTHCPGQLQETVMGKPRFTQAKACFACALITLAEAYWTPKSRKELLDATSCFDLTMRRIARSTSTFPQGVAASDFHGQQDANEFCLWMLEVLQTHNQMDSFQYKSIFGFEMTRAWDCLKCGHTSRSSANDVQLSLSIRKDQRNSLESCIAQELLRERLEGVYCENKACSYYTKKTNKPKNGMDVCRRTAFTQLPEILKIHFRRFGVNDAAVRKGRGRNAQFERATFRINNAVTYPPVLELSKYLAEGSEHESARYALNGVVLQSGSLSGGHYIAKTVTPKGVRKISDSSVSPSNLNDLLTPKDNKEGQAVPYILFYTRLRDGEEGPAVPRPAGNNKNGSAPNAAASGTDNTGSLGRSDAGFQKTKKKKRKFSDAQHSSAAGFKKHKQDNHRSNRF